jgi:hypothetical protein
MAVRPIRDVISISALSCLAALTAKGQAFNKPEAEHVVSTHDPVCDVKTGGVTMSEHSCLRSASIQDLPVRLVHIPGRVSGVRYDYATMNALERLYDAEWRKRGFLRSP